MTDPLTRATAPSKRSNKVKKEIKNHSFDFLIAYGGGSVIDLAKAIKYELLKEIPKKSIFKLIAIPSTVGTGAEVTQFATIWDFDKKIKVSVESPNILPEYYFLDFAAIKGIQIETALVTTLDAISHCFDSFWNKMQPSILCKQFTKR